MFFIFNRYCKHESGAVKKYMVHLTIYELQNIQNNLHTLLFDAVAYSTCS